MYSVSGSTDLNRLWERLDSEERQVSRVKVAGLRGRRGAVAVALLLDCIKIVSMLLLAKDKKGWEGMQEEYDTLRGRWRKEKSSALYSSCALKFGVTDHFGPFFIQFLCLCVSREVHIETLSTFISKTNTYDG